VRHFRIVECLGGDSQGYAYRAELDTGDHTVILYEYLPQGLARRETAGVVAQAGQQDVFSRACSAYATRLREVGLIGHPALPVMDDIWSEGGTVYAFGPWQPGRSLAAELGTLSGPLDGAQLATWLRSLADALSALHRQGLVHGNLSPQMVRVLDTGELSLPPAAGGLHTEHAPAWHAPEQHPLNPRPTPTGPWTDVYQLSALAHQMLLGHAPPAVMRRWEGVPLERLERNAQTLDERLILALRKGLAMQARTRPASVDEWMSLAGWPNRRQHARHGDGGSGLETLKGMPARAAALARTGVPRGHQPVSPAIQSRLDLLERRRARTPGWVWFSLALAIIATLGLLLGP
jgi:serine/threonine protein kinase